MTSLSTIQTIEATVGSRRLLFIGSLDAAPTGGGPIQFHRHFVERHDFAFSKLVEPAQPRLNSLRTGLARLDSMIDRLSRTRLFPHFVSLDLWLAARRAVPALLREAKAVQPDAIVTVAYGAYGFAAQSVAKRLGLPLITFFHDWWPDLGALQSRLGIRVFDWRTRRLYRKSDLALCVCEGMKQELGAHPNASVLYPIGGAPPVLATPRVARSRPRVVYLGGMTRAYGRMLSALSRAYTTASGTRPWELAVFGDARDWPPGEANEAARAGIYRGLRYGDAAAGELSEADIFLLVMDFEPETVRRVRTSFPSKLLDYCAHGKPVIAWVPEYSSVAAFCRNAEFPVLCPNPDPHALVRQIDSAVADAGWVARNAAAARRLAETEFSAYGIHSEMVTQIDRLIDQAGPGGLGKNQPARAHHAST